MKKMKTIKKLILVVIIITLGSCKTYYDAYTYEETVKVKNQTLMLMDSSFYKYEKYELKIDSLKVRITNLFEYQKTRQNNFSTVAQWNTFLRSNGTFYNFFNYWKETDSLKLIEIDSYKPQMSGSFDKIIELETKKK